MTAPRPVENREMLQNGVRRVGIIGAGHISEFHMRALSRVPTAQVVGIVDADQGRAKALCDKWGIARPFTNTRDLYEMGIGVVHVLTPPSSHATLTLDALNRGCHVYVEKPLATSAEDCDRIIAAAEVNRRTVCVGHSFLRDPILMRARRVIESGQIGEPLSVHYIRSTFYPKYRGGPLPEMYRSGGYPFRDMGVHGLYIIESILGPIIDARSTVLSTGRDPALHCDEWNVLLKCRHGQGAIHLSWNSRPQQHSVTVYGTLGVLRADMYAMSVSTRRARRIPEHVTRVVNSITEATQMAMGTISGLAGFALGRVRQYHGLQHLVEEFYETLRQEYPTPVTPEQARSVVAWTESIAAIGDHAKTEYLAAACPVPRATTLVTGGTGLIGRRLAKRLLQEGRKIRLLTRRIPSDPHLSNNTNVELILGDLGDDDAVERAVAGTTTVFHLGATMQGTIEEFERGTVVGTRNVVNAAVRHDVSRFINVSSLSVLHSLAGNRDSIITETWPLEPRPEWRGNYTRTKLEAEQIVREASLRRGLKAIILRPAEVIDDGPPRMTAGIALRIGQRLAVLGDGRSAVPLVYVDDLVDALLLAEKSAIADGLVVHLVDPVEFTQNQLIDRYQASVAEKLQVIHIPRWIVKCAGIAGDILSKLLGRRLPITSYRLQSASAARRFNCDLAARLLAWRPRIGVRAVLSTPAPSAAVDDSLPDGLTDRSVSPTVAACRTGALP
jgi:2-alkyl-3-oxoalkanoate reductase